MGTPSKGRGFGPMGMETSPRKRSQMAKRRAAQERRWASKASEVTVVKADRCTCGEWITAKHLC